MKRANSGTKSKLHTRNRNKQDYDLEALVKSHPLLKPYLLTHKVTGNTSIKFSNPQAVLELNKAILLHHYAVKNWSIPPGYLCPPIPGRADYVHNLADLLASFNNGTIPRGNKIVIYDLGVGANCIYPLVANSDYHWSSVGSDADQIAITNATEILTHNPSFEKHIDLRLQANKKFFFKSIMKADEYYDAMICNPPFYKSIEEANSATLRKVTNLSKSKTSKKPTRNFAGKKHELVYKGGEAEFISAMIKESKEYANQFFLFSTLVSQGRHLKYLQAQLDKMSPCYTSVTEMQQGNKTSRILSWSFLSEKQRRIWVKARWQ